MRFLRPLDTALVVLKLVVAHRPVTMLLRHASALTIDHRKQANREDRLGIMVALDNTSHLVKDTDTVPDRDHTGLVSLSVFCCIVPVSGAFPSELAILPFISFHGAFLSRSRS